MTELRWSALPDGQRKVLAFIGQHIIATGQSPTLKEIGDGLGGFTVPAARKAVQALIKKGFLTRCARYAHRGIIINHDFQNQQQEKNV